MKIKNSIKTFILKTQWPHVILPLLILTLYFVSLSWFLSWLLPEQYKINVNTVFVNKAWKLSLLAAIGFYLISFVGFKIKKNPNLTFENTPERLSVNDFFLILLPLTPVVQYILNNQDILSIFGSLYVLAVFFIFSLCFIILMPLLLGIVASTKTLMLLGMAFTFTITNMPSLSASFTWFERGSIYIQLSLFIALFFVSWVFYHLINRKFLYLVIAIFFLTNCTTHLFITLDNRNEKAIPATDNKLVEFIGSSLSPVRMPNIYLLIYDSYVINETMLAHGIDNSPQEKYLQKMGFKLYPHTYSVDSSSITTMSRVLNASTEFYGNERRAVSGDGVVQNLLMGFNYKTYGIFSRPYFFYGIGSSYDFSIPTILNAGTFFIKAIFMGEFRSDSNFDEERFKQTYKKYKLTLFKNISKKPRFVYSHSPSPNHSQNSGACRQNEIDLYRERLSRANNEMKHDVETIIHNDPGAIIVVAGDHGPYLTKNCYSLGGGHFNTSEISRLDIQDRYGTFLAIKWPTDDYFIYDDITVLQDIFPAIFAYLFRNEKLLKGKVESKTFRNNAVISGAFVLNGIIYGGINDGEPLFVGKR